MPESRKARKARVDGVHNECEQQVRQRVVSRNPIPNNLAYQIHLSIVIPNCLIG